MTMAIEGLGFIIQVSRILHRPVSDARKRWLSTPTQQLQHNARAGGRLRHNRRAESQGRVDEGHVVCGRNRRRAAVFGALERRLLRVLFFYYYY